MMLKMLYLVFRSLNHAIFKFAFFLEQTSFCLEVTVVLYPLINTHNPDYNIEGTEN